MRSKIVQIVSLPMALAPQDKFVQLFAQHQNRVYGYVRSLLPCYSDAEEAFQQTVLVLWKKWDQFDPNQDFVRWACGIAHLEVRNLLRKSARRDVYLSDHALELLAETASDSEDWLASRQSLLHQCIESLNARDRMLVENCYLQGVTIREASNKLSISENVMYKSLRKIRRKLFECIERGLAQGGAS